MSLRTWVLSLALVLALSTPGICQESLTLPCEVFEAGGVGKTDVPTLSGTGYILLRQANAEDRETLSEWLKQNSGSPVRFTYEDKEYRGILCRLAYCFGRGLLLHAEPIQPKNKAIIRVHLPMPR